MFYRLTRGVKRRVIEELRKFWSYHPQFPDLPGSIQGKYSYEVRPPRGIVVKAGSVSPFDLSSDHFIGVVSSYVTLAKYKFSPGVAIEWVREDAVAIQNAGGFPSAPGVYYIEMEELKDENGDGTSQFQFWVDPLLSVQEETVAMVSDTEGQLAQAPHTGSLVLQEMPSGWRLHEGINYTLSETGLITLTDPMPTGLWLQASYRYPGESRGPFPIFYERAHHTAIPGVVLAFGKKFEDGDKMAVIVHPIRCPAALEYGGRTDVAIDVDVWAKDVEEQEEITDESFMYFHAIAKHRLSSEGIELMDASIGGEAEEPFNDTGDEYFYTGSISMTFQTDWFVYVPVFGEFSQVAPLKLEDAQRISALGLDELAGEVGDIALMQSLGLEYIQDPFFRDRTQTFEGIR